MTLRDACARWQLAHGSPALAREVLQVDDAEYERWLFSAPDREEGHERVLAWMMGAPAS